jgi:hypothetical protein
MHPPVPLILNVLKGTTAMDNKHWPAGVLMSFRSIFVVAIFKLFKSNTTRDEKKN